MRSAICDVVVFVSGDALVLIVPLRDELTNSPLGNHGQIPQDEPGVLARELDLATEAKVVANEHTGPSDNAGGERLVVAVAQPQHPAVVVAGGVLGMDFHKAEVALTLVTEAVGLVANGEVGLHQRSLHGPNQFQMRDRVPGVSVTGGADGSHFIQLGGLRTAMKNEIGAASAADKGSFE